MIYVLTVAANKEVRLVGDTLYYAFYPHYATDNNTICPRNRLFLHTIFAENPWIQIVLGHSTYVAMVVVYNRQVVARKFIIFVNIDICNY
jgi:hypothetical protein